MSEGRNALLSAAEGLFAERGYSATSVRDICSAANVTQPSLYHFFGSKENLLIELIDERYGQYCDDLEAVLAKKNEAENVCRAYLEFVFSRMQKASVTAKFVFGIMFGPQQDVPKPVITKHLQRSRAILTNHLRRTTSGVEDERLIYASVFAHGIVTPAVLQFLIYGIDIFPEKMAESFAVRAAAILDDDLPVCHWPDAAPIS